MYACLSLWIYAQEYSKSTLDPLDLELQNQGSLREQHMLLTAPAQHHVFSVWTDSQDVRFENVFICFLPVVLSVGLRPCVLLQSVHNQCVHLWRRVWYWEVRVGLGVQHIHQSTQVILFLWYECWQHSPFHILGSRPWILSDIVTLVCDTNQDPIVLRSDRSILPVPSPLPSSAFPPLFYSAPVRPAASDPHMSKSLHFPTTWGGGRFCPNPQCGKSGLDSLQCKF